MAGRAEIPELIAQAKAGEAGAADRLLAQSRSYLNVLASARMEPWMRAKFDASDLVQQTMVEAHAGISAFEGTGEAEWKAYLKKMLQRNVLDAVRHFKDADKRDVRKERPDDGASVGPARQFEAGGDTPSRLAADGERDLELAAAIDSLPDDYREVIIARSLRKEPFADIAEALGRSVPATQMLWTRAVRKLEEVLQGRSELAD